MTCVLSPWTLVETVMDKCAVWFHWDPAHLWSPPSWRANTAQQRPWASSSPSCAWSSPSSWCSCHRGPCLHSDCPCPRRSRAGSRRRRPPPPASCSPAPRWTEPRRSSRTSPRTPPPWACWTWAHHPPPARRRSRRAPCRWGPSHFAPSGRLSALCWRGSHRTSLTTSGGGDTRSDLSVSHSPLVWSLTRGLFSILTPGAPTQEEHRGLYTSWHVCVCWLWMRRVNGNKSLNHRHPPWLTNFSPRLNSNKLASIG